jgi:hypothetical protein
MRKQFAYRGYDIVIQILGARESLQNGSGVATTILPYDEEARLVDLRAKSKIIALHFVKAILPRSDNERRKLVDDAYKSAVVEIERRFNALGS